MQGKSSDEVFLIQGEVLRALPARPFREGLFGKKLEEALQTLIEKHPELLPGKQMDPGSDDPPRFVLLCREMPVAGWSLDHLLVDQRAVLTLVEAKLIQNPESRREVVGQILEYAANAPLSWGGGQAREKAAEFWLRRGKKIDDVIGDAFRDTVDVEAFWRRVDDNLKQGKIRLIVAADELRPDVRRTIEYLNAEMSTVEIYGLELRCYGHEPDSLVLVPRLIGQTQATADRKAAGETGLWTVERLLDAYENLPNRGMGERLREVLDWAVTNGCFMEARAKTPVFGLRGRSGGRIVSFSPDWTYCYLTDKVYSGEKEERDRLVADLKALGMYERDLNPEDVVSGRNLVRKLADLTEDEFNKLLAIFSRYCEAGSGKGVGSLCLDE